MSEPHTPRANTESFKLATGVAGLFIVVMSTLGFTLDRMPKRSVGWSLRGSIAPETSGSPKPTTQNDPAPSNGAHSNAALQLGTVPV